MNLRDVVLVEVTEAEFQRLNFAHYGKPWEHRKHRYQFACVAEAPAYDNYEALLQEFRAQPYALHVGFFNAEKGEQGGWERIFASELTPETIQKVSDRVRKNSSRKFRFELAYNKNQGSAHHNSRRPQVSFEEREGLVVPFKVYIPQTYESVFSCKGTQLIPHKDSPIIALTDSVDFEVRLT